MTSCASGLAACETDLDRPKLEIWASRRRRRRRRRSRLLNWQEAALRSGTAAHAPESQLSNTMHKSASNLPQAAEEWISRGLQKCFWWAQKKNQNPEYEARRMRSVQSVENKPRETFFSTSCSGLNWIKYSDKSSLRLFPFHKKQILTFYGWELRDISRHFSSQLNFSRQVMYIWISIETARQSTDSTKGFHGSGWL